MKDLAGFVSDVVKKSHLEDLVIMDFQGPNHDYSLFGRKLADDLQAALAADPTIKLVDRSKYIEFVSREALLIPEANQPDPANWVASQVFAKSFVIGEYEESGSEAILHIRIYDCPKPRNIQNLKATFSNSAKMSSLHRQLLAATGEDALSAEQKHSTIEAYLHDGYSIPECSYCPQPPYSKEATAHKFSATLELVASIDESGHIADVVLLRGSFYGLNSATVDGVKRWKMKPSIAPDGKPKAVHQVVEVTFRMY